MSNYYDGLDAEVKRIFSSWWDYEKKEPPNEDNE